VLAESGSRVSACIGIARQRFPDAGITVTWYFIEPRVRLWSGLAYSHGRLGNVPETEFRHTNRITAGLAWVP
jgi:hypothetical protein